MLIIVIPAHFAAMWVN